jgi:predicted nucleic acid-binding protein
LLVALRQQKLLARRNLRNAAIAPSPGWMVATRNTQDFLQIQALEIQNWTV